MTTHQLRHLGSNGPRLLPLGLGCMGMSDFYGPADESESIEHRAVFDDFISAMRPGGRPACDGADGRRSVEVIEAIYRASVTGAPVTLTGAAAIG